MMDIGTDIKAEIETELTAEEISRLLNKTFIDGKRMLHCFYCGSNTIYGVYNSKGYFNTYDLDTNERHYCVSLRMIKHYEKQPNDEYLDVFIKECTNTPPEFGGSDKSTKEKPKQTNT